jgi:hypothetical protein
MLTPLDLSLVEGYKFDVRFMLQDVDSQKPQPLLENFVQRGFAHSLNDFDTTSVQRQEITTEGLESVMNQNGSECADNEVQQLPLSTSGRSHLSVEPSRE